MTRTLRERDRVEVLDFGRYPGIIVDALPYAVIQGRSHALDNWVEVRLDDGRTWRGSKFFCVFRGQSPVSRKG